MIDALKKIKIPLIPDFFSYIETYVLTIWKKKIKIACSRQSEFRRVFARDDVRFSKCASQFKFLVQFFKYKPNR